MIKKISTKNMSHDDWLAARRKSIGGSDAGAICGMNQYASPYSIYADKLGLLPPKDDNEAMRQGRDLEQYVAERFCEVTGKHVQRDNHIIINSDYPFAHANIDRVVIGEDAGLECKTTSSLNLKAYKNGEYPDYYYVQCMHYLMVTGKKKWYLAVLVFGRDFMIFEIERDEDEIERLAEIESEFYTNNILAKNPPPPDGSKSASEIVTSLYPSSRPGTECDLSLYSSEIKEYISLKTQISALESILTEKANVIKDAMKDAEMGYSGDNKVSWKTSVRKSFDKSRFISEHPEIDLSKYMKQTTARIFKIT